MPNAKSTKPRPLYLCLCSKCSKRTHSDNNGIENPGLYVDVMTRDSHRLADERNKALRQEDPSSDSSKSSELSSEGDLEPVIENEDRRLDQLVRMTDRIGLEPQPGTSHNTSSMVEPDEVYDTTEILTRTLHGDSPIVVHISLIAALMAVFDNASLDTSSWLLKVQRDSLEMMSVVGITPGTQSKNLSYTGDLALRRIPRDITTVLRWLNIDPKLIMFNCCSACFSLYPVEDAPERCTQLSVNVPGTLDNFGRELHASAPLLDHPSACSTALVRSNGNPIRKYAYQDFNEWIARFICRPSVEEDLDKSLVESCKPYDPSRPVHDIHESYIWKDFLGPDGKQYTANSGHLTFGMFMDGINPYGNKKSGQQVTITFIVMVCLTLPYQLRFRPENIFLVGIAPGPKEPSLEHTNWILGPVVIQLKSLWTDGLYLSKTPLHPEGRLIRAALLPFIADLPACRRALGLASHSSTAFCSLCHLPRSEITNLNQASWTPKSSDQHNIWASAARDADNVRQREDIFKDHGVRYSVLIELPYWKLIDYHVIDSMHNLLLGLLAWHCTRFWAMTTQVENSPEPRPCTTLQVLELVVSRHSRIQRPATNRPSSHNHPPGSLPLVDAQFGDDTSSGDDSYDPFDSVNYGWDGSYKHPLEDEVVFDLQMLKRINRILPRIHIPTWIERAIPRLGKEGFGKLKADEWRNLFTIQLPLVLIMLWTGDNQSNGALLHNFAHLVSLTNLALKRTMTSERIERYKHHINLYLTSSLQLFKHCSLAPNHHMAIHLAQCLEKFGPVRSWWSFSFERLMGRILRACHNNHLGEIEITFLRSFCRAGNLGAILRDETKLPEEMKPYASKLRDIFDPETFTPNHSNAFRSQPLENTMVKQLVQRLNAIEAEDCEWLSSDKWENLSTQRKEHYAPVVSQADFHSKVQHKDVLFTTFDRNPANSVVHVISRSNGAVLFGKIISIFNHQRFPTRKRPPVTETWLAVEYFHPIPTNKPNPFSRLGERDVQAHFRLNKTTKPHLTHINEVVSHCAWLEYRPKEIHDLFDEETVGLISLDR